MYANRFVTTSIQISDGTKTFSAKAEPTNSWQTYSFSFMDLIEAGLDINKIKTIEIVREKGMPEDTWIYLSPMRVDSDYIDVTSVFEGAPADDVEEEENIDNNVNQPTVEIDESVLSEELLEYYIENSTEDMLLFSTDEPGVITAEMFAMLKEAGKGIRYEIVDENGSVIAFWDIKDITDTQTDMNMAVEFISSNEAAIKGITGDNKIAFVKPVHNDTFPGKTMLYIANKFGFDSKTSIKLYAFNGGKLETVDVVVGVTSDASVIGLGLIEGGEYTITTYKPATETQNDDADNDANEENKMLSTVWIIVIILAAVLLVGIIAVVIVFALKNKKV